MDFVLSHTLRIVRNLALSRVSGSFSVKFNDFSRFSEKMVNFGTLLSYRGFLRTMSLIGPVKRVTDPADPNRCQGTTRSGQCPYLAEPGSSFCRGCGGNSVQQQKILSYKLTKASDTAGRLHELHQLNKIAQLEDMITLMQFLVEESFQMRESEGNVATVANITKLAKEVRGIIRDVNDLKTRAGMTLEKTALYNFAQTVISIINKRLRAANFPGWEVTQREIGGEILAAFDTLEN